MHETFLKFDRICRICLYQSDETLERMRSILEPSTTELVSLCGDVQISELDGLPSMICVDCLEKAQNCFSFRQQCKRSDTLLREMSKSGSASVSKGVDDQHQTYYLVQFNDNELYLTSTDTEFPEQNNIAQAPPPLMPFNEPSTHLELEAAINQALQAEIDKGRNTDKHNEIMEFLNDNFINLESEELADEYMQMINKQIDSVEMIPTVTEELSTQTKDIEQVDKNAVEPVLNCKVCNNTFKNKISFRRHIKRHAENEHTDDFSDGTLMIQTMKKHICDICGKAFGEKSKLNVHSLSHTGVKNYICHICNKRFTLPHNLKSHYKTHLNQKDFICSFCNKAFTQKINLQSHIRSKHTFEKPYVCTIESCDKAFSTKGELSTHMMRHSGEKKPSAVFCSICSKGCKNNTELRIHNRSHSKEKPYKCTLCNKSYTMQSHLAVHMRIHSGIRPFQCPVNSCSKSFYTGAILNKHLAVHAKSGKIKKSS